jgi:hypothetical protein
MSGFYGQELVFVETVVENMGWPAVQEATFHQKLFNPLTSQESNKISEKELRRKMRIHSKNRRDFN